MTKQKGEEQGREPSPWKVKGKKHTQGPSYRAGKTGQMPLVARGMHRHGGGEAQARGVQRSARRGEDGTNSIVGIEEVNALLREIKVEVEPGAVQIRGPFEHTEGGARGKHPRGVNHAKAFLFRERSLKRQGL